MTSFFISNYSVGRLLFSINQLWISLTFSFFWTVQTIWIFLRSRNNAKKFLAEFNPIKKKISSTLNFLYKRYVYDTCTFQTQGLFATVYEKAEFTPQIFQINFEIKMSMHQFMAALLHSLIWNYYNGKTTITAILIKHAYNYTFFQLRLPMIFK